MKRILLSLTALLLATTSLPNIGAAAGDDLAERFASPPPSARPWVFWFWINGNISREGITADLEAMQRAGIGGVLWMEVSGPWWAPDGQVEALGPQWHDCHAVGGAGMRPAGPGVRPVGGFRLRQRRPAHHARTLDAEAVLERDGGRRRAAGRAWSCRGPRSRKTLSAWLRPGAEIGAQGPRDDREDGFVPGRGRGRDSRAGIAAGPQGTASATSGSRTGPTGGSRVPEPKPRRRPRPSRRASAWWI